MPRQKIPLATVTVSRIRVQCGGCGETIPGQTGFVRLSHGADVIREDLAKVKDTPDHNAYSLRATIVCRSCGVDNRVPKNWQRNIW